MSARAPFTPDQMEFLARLGGGITFPAAERNNMLGSRPFKIVVGTASNSVPVYPGRCLLVGMLLKAGAATATMHAYNVGWQGSSNQGQIKADPTRQVSVVAAAVYDGWINFPILCEDGLVCDLDQTDAEGYVYYVPLPPG